MLFSYFLRAEFVFCNKNSKFTVLENHCHKQTGVNVQSESKSGALANFINPLFTTEQKIARLNEAESKVTIILDAMFPYMKEAVPSINTDKIVILPAISSLPVLVRKLVEIKSKKSADLIDFCKNDGRYCSWDSFVKSGNVCVGETEAAYEANRPVVMVYSSGTTGASKGIVLTNDGVNSIFTHF